MAAQDNEAPVRVALYSSNSDSREAVQMAIGRRVAADLPRITWEEVATPWALQRVVDRGGIDLIIADGEAQPAGGMGLCRQLKNEVFRCPPVVVLTGRPQDAWLAAWSQADAAVPHPLDPIEMQKAVADLLRPRIEARRASAVDALS